MLQCDGIKYDWFEFGGFFGIIRADELELYRDEIKKYGIKCIAVYFNKTQKEMFPLLYK